MPNDSYPRSYPRSAVDLFSDDEDPLLQAPPPPFSGIRLPDERTLAWAEYGNPRGVPCVLIPDLGSTRLAPNWLLHDAAVPASIRLLAVDRPGVGASDPVGIGGREDLAADLMRMVQTLAVGRVAMIGIGRGVDDALAFADRFPGSVTAVVGVSARVGAHAPLTGRRHLIGQRDQQWLGPMPAWARAAGRRDLRLAETWRRVATKVPADAREAIGNRWEESDFRVAVADDLGLGQADRLRSQRLEPNWVHRWTTYVPVHLWHGRQEGETHVSALRAVAGQRPSWQVHAVPGCSALLGFWPDLLLQAESSFRAGASPVPDAPDLAVTA